MYEPYRRRGRFHLDNAVVRQLDVGIINIDTRNSISEYILGGILYDLIKNNVLSHL